MSIDKTKLNYEMSKEDREKFLNMPEEDKISVFEKILSNLDYQKEVEKTLSGIQEELDKLKKDILSDSRLNKTCEEEAQYYTPKKVTKILAEINNNSLMQSPPFEKLLLKDATVDTILGDYLKQRGITQVWLAEQIGVDKTTIINIIKKPKSISLLNAYKISKVLGEDMETLFPFIQGE